MRDREPTAHPFPGHDKGTRFQLKDKAARTEDKDGLLSFQSVRHMGKRLKFTPEGGFPGAPRHQSQFTWRWLASKVTPTALRGRVTERWFTSLLIAIYRSFWALCLQGGVPRKGVEEIGWRVEMKENRQTRVVSTV